MSKVYADINTAADNWGTVITRVNNLVDTLAAETLTCNSAANGALTVGNGYVSGILGALTLTANTLQGGIINSSANLSMGSNVVYLAGTSMFNGNVTVNATNIMMGANVNINTTAHFVGNATVNVVANSSAITIGANVLANLTTIELGTSNVAGFMYSNTSPAVYMANSTDFTLITPGSCQVGNTSQSYTFGITGLVFTSLFFGNSTANLNANSTEIIIANSTNSSNLNPSSLWLGNTTVNATMNTIQITMANSTQSLFMNTISLNLGNSGTNATINTTAFQIINSTAAINVSPISVSLGNTTANLIANSTTVKLANSSTSVELLPGEMIFPNTAGGFGANSFTINTTALLFPDGTVQTTAGNTQFQGPPGVSPGGAGGATPGFNMGNTINLWWLQSTNATLQNPTNAVPGQSGMIRVDQPMVGAGTLAYGSAYRFDGDTAIVLGTSSSSFNKANYISYTCVNSSVILLSLVAVNVSK